MSATPNNQKVILALAPLGGHLKSNSPPDWIVLGRAFDKLLVLDRAGLGRERTRRRSGRQSELAFAFQLSQSTMNSLAPFSVDER
jgi:hypothetical protein